MLTQVIWPWWVRLSHWLNAAGILAIWVLVFCFYETDALHRQLGYAVLILVVLRMAGAGFTKVKSAKLNLPSALQLKEHLNAMRTNTLKPHVGHNPLGQMAVYVMWGMIALLALTGWLSRTDAFWGEDWPVDLHAVLSYALMVLVVVHVVAVVIVSHLSQQALLRQMLTGKYWLTNSSNAEH
jgi:cytochrome b